LNDGSQLRYGSAMPGTTSVDFNPYAHEFHDDPFPVYRQLRDETPAYHNAELGFWALSRYDDVIAGLHDWETYTSTQGITLESKSALPMMITMDPPDHTKMRRLISRVFTPKRVAEMEPHVRALANQYLDQIADRGKADLIADYSALLPMAVISQMLGVPFDDQAMLREWTDLMLHREPGVPDVTPAGQDAGYKVFEYFLDDVQRKRTQPGDDLVSGLLDAEIDGERLDDIDIVGLAFLLIIAGNETTTKLLGNSLYWLTKFPGEKQKILDDPSCIPDAVEETLRYEGSTQLMVRTSTRDVPAHGEVIPAGSKVMLLLGSANRDERYWDDPDRFDIDRDKLQHLAFGHGIHVCLGAALARLEMKVSLEEIHRRIPAYEVDHDACERIHSGNVRGYSRMPMSF
jgi:cytochrome P450